MSIQAGDEAPDFTLKDSAGNDVRLSDFRGRQNVVLVFYPFAFTGVCQGEMCELRDDLTTFETSGARVLAVSCDTRPALAKWAEEQSLSFPLLSDHWPHGEVSRRYGVFNEAVGCANRATFVIDKEGRVVDTFATAELRTPRDKASYEAALAKLG